MGPWTYIPSICAFVICYLCNVHSRICGEWYHWHILAPQCRMDLSCLTTSWLCFADLRQLELQIIAADRNNESCPFFKLAPYFRLILYVFQHFCWVRRVLFSRPTSNYATINWIPACQNAVEMDKIVQSFGIKLDCKSFRIKNAACCTPRYVQNSWRQRVIGIIGNSAL